MFHSARCNHGSQSVEPQEYSLKDWPVESDVDVDKHPEITEKYKVQGIPVIIITDGEKELSRKAGEKTYSELYSWLEELISKNVK